MYAGFGTLEQLVEDLQQDEVRKVRVDHLHVPEVPEEYGVRFDRFGVMVSARVDGEVRYAWLVIGVQQRLSTWPMWLNEGLAEFFSPTTTDRQLKWKGKRHPGRRSLKRLIGESFPGTMVKRL